MVSLGVLVWWLDLRRMLPGGRSLVALGRNASIVYIVSEMIWSLSRVVTMPGVGGEQAPLHDWLFETVFRPLASPANASPGFALAVLALMILLARVMDARRWYIKI